MKGSRWSSFCSTSQQLPPLLKGVSGSETLNEGGGGRGAGGPSQQAFCVGGNGSPFPTCS